MNDHDYRELYEKLHAEFAAFCQEVNARMLAFETQLEDMRRDQQYERDLRLSNADTQEVPTVEWSDDERDGE